MRKEELQAIRQIMQEELKPINERLVNLEQGQVKLEQGQIKLEQRQTKLELIIENEIIHSIKIIAEGHLAINQKLDEKIALENRIEDIENRVSVVEYALKKAE